MQTCTQCGQAKEAPAESCSGCGVAVSTGSKHILKRALCLLGCACWAFIGLGFGLFLIEYLFQGAGIHIFGISISSVSVLLGVVHVSGLAFAALFSWALAIWLGACGMTSGGLRERR